MATTVPSDISKQLLISIYVKRDVHDNGMTLKEYADAVIAGTHPILDHDEYVYQFGAIQEEIDLVVNWATANGLQVISSDAGIATVKLQGTVGLFNSLFNITLVDVTDDTRTYVNYTGTVTIPSAIIGVVENVLGFDQSFVATKHAVTVPLNATNPDTVNPNYSGAVTPVDVATAYNLPAGDGYGGCIGIFELTYSGYVTGYSTTDVTNSFSRIGLTAPTIVNINVDGASASTTSDAESMLDIYCAGAVAPRAKIAYYTAPNGGTTGINDNILAAAADTVNNPSVLSISWGIGDGNSFDTAMQTCVVKGITVIVSSGDHGATGGAIDSSSCTSPYMISAGGTNIGITSGTKIGEYAWVSSGGGVSSSQPRPSWQNGLTYTTKTNTGTLGTPTALPRRGIPDISAPADPYTGYQFYVNGILQQYGGTSAAAPFLAGAIVRLNQLLGKRISLPMSTFYGNTTAFTDITGGDNISGYSIGYAATTGWDAATGLGVINGPNFYKLFKTGSTFPRQNYGFRPTTGVGYPRPYQKLTGR